MHILPVTSDPLPDWTFQSDPSVTEELAQQFVTRALERRADFLAADLRRRSAEELLPAAANLLRPQLDVNLSSGYSGLIEGTNFAKPLASPFRNIKGMDAIVSLNYSFAPRNNFARGQLAQATASFQQAKLRHFDLSRAIASGVITAMTTLASSVARLRKARESVQAYQTALQGEQEKFRLGLGSLVDVLTLEDRLTGSLSAELQAHADYAIALENLRFATGTIVEPNSRVHQLDRTVFLTPPFQWGER
jgi:outer membrane protein